MTTDVAGQTFEPAFWLRETSRLLHREARLLDNEDLVEWLNLLSDDVEVVVPVGASTQPGRDQLAMVREGKFGVEARVWRVQQTGLNHSQDPPSRTIRAVSNIEVEAINSTEAAVHFVTVLYTYRPGGQRAEPAYTIPMRCEYVVRRTELGFRIARRQLNLLQRDGTLPPMTFVL